MRIKKGDTRGWTATLTTDSVDDDLTEVGAVSLYIRHRVTQQVKVQGGACIIRDRSATSIDVTYLPEPEQVDTLGVYDVLWVAEFLDGREATWPSAGYDELVIEDDFT